MILPLLNRSSSSFDHSILNPEKKHSTRVANELGAGNPDGARSAVRVVLSMAGIDAVVVSGSLLAARRLVGIAYSSEEEVISAVAAMVPLVCITAITDCLQGILSGLLYYLTLQEINYSVIAVLWPALHHCGN